MTESEQRQLLRASPRPAATTNRAASVRVQIRAREATEVYAKMATAGVVILVVYACLFPFLLSFTLFTHGFQWSDLAAARAVGFSVIPHHRRWVSSTDEPKTIPNSGQ